MKRRVAGPAKQAATLESWAAIPGRIRKATAGLSGRQLDRRGGSEGRSIRELVHHLVEANLVASTIVIAALGSPGCTFDWSWLMPDEAWIRRLGYAKTPIGPALNLLEALCPHVVRLVRTSGGGLRSRVALRDSPGAKLRPQTVEQVLAEECEHAAQHLRDIRETVRGAGPDAGKT
jgi:hypothetical protein